LRATQRQLIGTIQHVGMRGMAWLGLVGLSIWGWGCAVSEAMAAQLFRQQPAARVNARMVLNM
jgi:hypothetical protein